MSMIDPHSEPRAGQDLVNWLHDQVGALKAQLARMQQQHDQSQAALLDVNEKLRDAEARTRDVASRTMGLPVMQDQVRQLAGLLERIQDTEVLIDAKFEMFERTLTEERQRDQSEKNDLYRRVQDLERSTEVTTERQGGINEAYRHFQDENARAHLQAQTFAQQLETLESRSGRMSDALTRLEQAHADHESSIRALRREDDVLAERARLAHEVAARLESELHAQAEEYRALPLLAERVELLRAERQRVEDRVSRLEGTVDDTATRLGRQEEITAQIDTRMKGHDGRIDHVHNSTLEYRRTLSEQLLKLNQMIERMKRRQIDELERDMKDLRVQANQLKNDDDI